MPCHSSTQGSPSSQPSLRVQFSPRVASKKPRSVKTASVGGSDGGGGEGGGGTAAAAMAAEAKAEDVAGAATEVGVWEAARAVARAVAERVEAERGWR